MSHQADIFTPEELRQFALDRKRQALTAFLASGFPTSPRHEDMLNQSTTSLKSAQIGESSQPRQRLAQYNDGNDRNTQGSIRGTTTLPIEAKVKICSPTFKCWIEATAKFDTGTMEDWMSTHLVKRLGFLPEPGPIILYQTFSGETLQSDLVIKKVTWGSIGSDNRTWVREFRLAPENAPFEVLFGSDFISSEQIYTFNEAKLILTKKQDSEG
ncbi:hypothetical protein L207DRAFT_517887 [Hyaloscypha variabilis F]|uniref:Uncharacterized protein n=1 Tax=Hyaloscypha variabilis (strain UAMH 11265 / GT02V1 / F) TaxID=1149755 RepID=A0A2J6R5R9_HYAVF|nr:hypothetical protein L207DRAFT_517887 [Hyaloscypha variabilis F]